MTRKGVLLFGCFGVDAALWKAEFDSISPDVEVRYWPDAGDPAEVDYAFTWEHPPGLWADFPNLKAIFSYGAGVDRLLRDPRLPPDVPIIRLVDTSLVTAMDEFVLMRVLHHHRDMEAYAAAQRRASWAPVPMRLAGDRIVGVMGLGQLGLSCARTVASAGFRTRGWSRRRKTLEGVQTWAGWDELPRFLEGCEILICLLPLTAETENILNGHLFEQLARGAYLINVGRGAHLVDEDLLDAVASGQLKGATLDVFRTEPLPPEHPFWRSDGITITPHISAPTQARTAARILMDNVKRLAAGEVLENLVDRQTGY